MFFVYFWIVVGIIFCFVEVIFLVDFVVVVMGLSVVVIVGVVLLVFGSFVF